MIRPFNFKELMLDRIAAIEKHFNAPPNTGVPPHLVSASRAHDLEELEELRAELKEYEDNMAQ